MNILINLSIVCVVFILNINIAKSHGADIFAQSKNGTPFFGFNTSVDFYGAYRGEGKESIDTFGHSGSAFAGYSYQNFVLVGGYEHSFLPSEYNGTFNSMGKGNLTQYPEIFAEINYFLSRQYMLQPYFMVGLSFGQEMRNGTPSDDGMGVHYDFGGGINIILNDKWTLNFDASILTVKHQALPANVYIKTGVDIGYQVTKNLTIIYALTYKSPKLNNRQLEATMLPVEIELHDASIFAMELSFMFN